MLEYHREGKRGTCVGDQPCQAGAPGLPPFQYVADVSIKVAEAVANMAKSQGLAQAKETDMSKAVKNLKWYPEY